MDNYTRSHLNWKEEDAQVFWGEIALHDHVVQVYENEKVFLDLLCGFVTGGIRVGDSVVVIATANHLALLKDKLIADGFDPFYLTLREQYIAFDAEETLSKFIINGKADEVLFNSVVSDVLIKAKRNGRKQIRIFGEMVALLWAKGNTGAAFQLEQLWNRFCTSEQFCLFCAYPKSCFNENAEISVGNICNAHSKVIDSLMSADTNNILYQQVVA